MKQKVVVGTRYFEPKAEKAENSIKKLQEFCARTLSARVSKILVAVNVDADVSGAILKKWPENVIIFPVTPWGRFVGGLNAILTKGRDEWIKGSLLLFSSVEIHLTEKAIIFMASHLDGKTLAVGAATKHHEYIPGFYGRANGRKTPWHTCLMYNPKRLWLTGFPLVGDGPVDQPQNAGVEKLVPMSLLQLLDSMRPEPEQLGMEVKLTQVPDIKWGVQHFTDERLAAHLKKLASKDERPDIQLKAIGLPRPMVRHV